MEADRESSGVDALRGNTRSHPEHDGQARGGRWYYAGDGMGEQVDAGICGGVAQLGEHLPCKQGVKSSSLSISTQKPKDKSPWFLYQATLYLENCITKKYRRSLNQDRSDIYIEQIICLVDGI